MPSLPFNNRPPMKELHSVPEYGSIDFKVAAERDEISKFLGRFAAKELKVLARVYGEKRFNYVLAWAWQKPERRADAATFISHVKRELTRLKPAKKRGFKPSAVRISRLGIANRSRKG
ncbi:MAG TPA: hypothetical protein VJH23_01525 [archaeon]|nr:hypothetical protein [archaeon]